MRTYLKHPGESTIGIEPHLMNRHYSSNIAIRWPFLLALCIAGLVTLGIAAESPKLSDEAIRQIEAFQAEKATRTPAQQKMDSQLVHGARIARDHRSPLAG